MLAVTALLTSCSKTQLTSLEKSIAVSALPSATTTYVKTTYPDAYIANATEIANSDASYIVYMSTLEELAFDKQGNPMGNADAHRHFGDGDGDGGHGHGGPHDGHMHNHHGDGLDSLHDEGCHNHDSSAIETINLATAITDYINLNYAGYTVRHAHLETSCQGDSLTEVVAESADGSTWVKLFFDSSNNFVMAGTRTTYAAVPQVIKDYVTTNYAAYTAKDKATMLTLANGTIQYAVFLEIEHQSHKRVIFNADGTFVCEQTH